MTAFEERAGAGGRDPTIEGGFGRDGAGHRCVHCWPVGAAKVADVATHEHEGIGRRAREGANVPDGMAGDIEEVEATVSEEVIGRESADSVVGVEGWFADGAAFEVLVKHRAVLIRGVSRHEGLLESRADV